MVSGMNVFAIFFLICIEIIGKYPFISQDQFMSKFSSFMLRIEWSLSREQSWAIAYGDHTLAALTTWPYQQNPKVYSLLKFGAGFRSLYSGLYSRLFVWIYFCRLFHVRIWLLFKIIIFLPPNGLPSQADNLHLPKSAGASDLCSLIFWLRDGLSCQMLFEMQAMGSFCRQWELVSTTSYNKLWNIYNIYI